MDSGVGGELQATRICVLVIDDEDQLLRAYRRMIGKAHEVEVALGGARAIEILEKDSRWDVIVCDLLMPGVDGAAVLGWVEEHRAELAPRFLFCSGGAFTQRGVALAEQQRERLLDKPVTRAQLEAAISAIMANKPIPR